MVFRFFCDAGGSWLVVGGFDDVFNLGGVETDQTSLQRGGATVTLGPVLVALIFAFRPLSEADGTEFLEKIDEACEHIAEFKPDVLIISAGFDAHVDCLVGQLGYLLCATASWGCNIMRDRWRVPAETRRADWRHFKTRLTSRVLGHCMGGPSTFITECG